MILSRKKLREHKIDDKTIKSILIKARGFNIAYEGMSRNAADSIVPALFFKKSDWVEKQKEWTDSVRVDCVRVNRELLRIVEGIK